MNDGVDEKNEEIKSRIRGSLTGALESIDSGDNWKLVKEALIRELVSLKQEMEKL